MSHPSAAYGKALMKQDNKGGTLDPVQPANRHRNMWRQRSVKRRLAKKLPPSSFRSGEALWESSECFLKRRLAKSGFRSGEALWGSSGRFLKRKLAPNNFRNRGAL